LAILKSQFFIVFFGIHPRTSKKTTEIKERTTMDSPTFIFDKKKKKKKKKKSHKFKTTSNIEKQFTIPQV